MLKQSEVEYLKHGKNAPSGASGLLVSSSKYLNSARLRDVLAQEALRKSSRDIPLAFLVPDAMQAFEELKDLELITRSIEEERNRRQEFAAWLDARAISSYGAGDLSGYAPETLGARVHDFVANSGYAIDFMFLEAPVSDYEYLQKRLAQNHDIEHMVTGFGTDPCGENALMTCNATSWLRYFGAGLAGELCRFNVYLTMVGTIRAAMHYPEVLPAFYEALHVGHEMGSALKQPLFLTRWEDYFEWTIVDIRKELNIVSSPVEGAWAWTEEAWQEPPES